MPSARTIRRVVVADDNVDAADAMAMFVETLGVEVRTVYEGLETVSVVEAFRPDLVLLDIAMPGLDGHEIARKIRGEDWGEEVMLVALTGWGREEDKRRTREAGFDGHLVKPVDFDGLERLIAGPPVSTRRRSTPR